MWLKPAISAVDVEKEEDAQPLVGGSFAIQVLGCFMGPTMPNCEKRFALKM